MTATLTIVIPAKAGTQRGAAYPNAVIAASTHRVPACTGMTVGKFAGKGTSDAR